jgi:recombination protein RecA
MATDKEKSSSKDKDKPLDKEKAIQNAIAQIEKQFGKGSIMRLGEAVQMNVACISTGSLTLDVALGIGGLPRGRIVEIYGPESSGKTTVALHVVAEAQKAGGKAAFIDVEHALDPVYAKALGVDIDNLLVSQPDTGEQAMEITEALVRTQAIDVVVVDSVAAMVPKAEIEGEMGDTHVGLQARLMSQALRKLTSCIGRSNCIAIFINQLREKVGVVYGNPEVTPGGRALKFYSSVRLDVRRTDSLKNGTDIIGNRTKVKVVKNKVAPPFREAEFDIIYGKGISRVGEILDTAVMLNIIQKSGAWFNCGELRLGQGRDNVKEYMLRNPEFTEGIAAQVMQNADKLAQIPKSSKKKKKGKRGQDEDDDSIESVDLDVDVVPEDEAGSETDSGDTSEERIFLDSPDTIPMEDNVEPVPMAEGPEA